MIFYKVFSHRKTGEQCNGEDFYMGGQADQAQLSCPPY